MLKQKVNIQFCGFGGQGIVLSAVIFGTTAVTRAGFNAVQTQSYGSEARGGECQAEVIVSSEAIESPLADRMDILVAMSQQALDKYLGRLKAGGTLIYDPEFVAHPGRDDIARLPVGATQIAGELGVKLAANMVMLGYLQQASGLFAADQLEAVIEESVKARFVEVNITAARRGMALATDQNTRVEV